MEKSLREKVKRILDAHVCEPSLVHGDLWSGNQAYTKGSPDGEPVIFDPAVYVRVWCYSFLSDAFITAWSIRSTATERWTLPWRIFSDPSRSASAPSTTSAGHHPRASSCARPSTTSTTFLTTSSCSAGDIWPKPKWWWAPFWKHPYDVPVCMHTQIVVQSMDIFCQNVSTYVSPEIVILLIILTIKFRK